jgi:hypothetical protein
MIVTETPTWTCPFGCIGQLEAATVAERWDHAIDFHLRELKKASAQTLNLIVLPR